MKNTATPETAAPAAPSPCLATWHATNWRLWDSRGRFVVFAPEAGLHERLAWCWGQVREMADLLNAYGDFADGADTGEMAAALCAFMQARMRPLELAMFHLCEQAFADASRAKAQGGRA